jgi:L-2-hydroxycarboxylate dehydrogenase (NAD+)
LLAGSLNAAAFGREAVYDNTDDRSVTNSGHAIIALDIAAFGDVDAVRANAAESRSVRHSRRRCRTPAVRPRGEHRVAGLCRPHGEWHSRAGGPAAFA